MPSIPAKPIIAVASMGGKELYSGFLLWKSQPIFPYLCLGTRIPTATADAGDCIPSIVPNITLIIYLWLIVNLLVNIRITTTRVLRAEIVSVMIIIFFCYIYQ